MRRNSLSIALIALATLVPSTGCAESPNLTYQEEIDRWHDGREERLKSPTGWLSLVGLHSLSQAKNRLGSADDNDLRLPEFAPAHIGRIEVNDAGYRFVAAEGLEATVDGKAVSDLPLQHDQQPEPTFVEVGRLLFYVIERADQPYLRVKDTVSPLIADFEGIERWPVDKSWRIEARWESYDPPKQIGVPDVLGNLNLEPSPGAAVFERGGQIYRLEPTGEAGDELFLVFGDETNGDTSYGGGRFLYLDPPRDGRVILDFNRAYNPPCIFTPFATCPLPTASNRIDFEVLAGEKTWGEGHE
jgi:uncharacterized protein